MVSKLNKPAKVLTGNATSASTYEQWPYNDGEGDPYWSGGSNPKYYRWTIDVDVYAYTHGSHLTRKPFEYNGLDINVGDWIAGSSSGIALKIISVVSKTETTASLVVEDVLRYNTFRSPTGDGLFGVPGSITIFTINENGDPVLDPLPVGYMSSDFIGNIQSRFNAFSLQENFLIEQTAHGFDVGDTVAIDPITQIYEKADSNSLEYIVGAVDASGPGPNAFLLNPTTRIVENFEPALPGSVGSFIYADPSSPGDLTTTKTSRKVFLQLSDAIETYTTGTVLNPTVSISDQLIINGVTVTFTGTTLADAISDINSAMSFAGLGIVASDPLVPNIIHTTLSLNYGLVGAYVDASNVPPTPAVPNPATATINGTLVTFDDYTDGLAAYGVYVAIESDMARQINAAAIPNIVASYTASNLIITETTGAAITVTPGATDDNSILWAGASSCTGLPTGTTAASTDKTIKLTRADGGEIILQNETGDPIGDLGITSVANGRLPFALIIEQGIRKGDLYVVADITARDALDVLTGDQAYVIDKGDGEWGMYLWNGSAWKVTSIEESAEVDSDTVSVTITSASGAGGGVLIASVNGANSRTGSGTRVSPVSIEVTSPFDGSPIISVGNSGNVNQLLTDDLVDLSTVGSYVSTPVYQYTGTADTDIKVYFGAAGVTGTIGAVYTNGQTISINSNIVTLSTGTTVDDAKTDINNAAISGVRAYNSGGALRLHGNPVNLVLAEGSGTALADLGFTPGTITAATTGSAKVTITYS